MKETAEKRKQLLLVGSLLLLTVMLMVFFKYNAPQFGEMVKKGHENLLDFYAQNLRPIFAAEGLTNKEVFNFAVSGSLPIDKDENKYFQVGTNPEGEAFYEIKNISPAPLETDYYDSFISKHRLDEEQIASLDSILKSYQPDIFTSLLSDNDKAYAVNKGVNELLTALRLDLQNFAFNNLHMSSSNDSASENLLDSLSSLARELKSINREEFLLITPDTVLNILSNIDPESMDFFVSDEYDDFIFHFTPVTLNDSVHIFSNDSALIKLTLHSSSVDSKESIAKYFSLKFSDSFDKSLSIAFEADTNTGSFGLSILEEENDSLVSVNMKFDVNNLTRFIGASISAFADMDLDDSEDLEIKLDSLVRKFEIITVDSLKKSGGNIRAEIKNNFPHRKK